MIVRSLRVILLIVFFLHSKVGVAFNVHYCGGHIAQISTVFNATGCGMEKKTSPVSSEVEFSTKSCCEDELIVEQNDDEFKETNSLKTFHPPIYVLHPPCAISYAATPKSTPLNTRPPPKEVPFYLQYCSLVFYEKHWV